MNYPVKGKANLRANKTPWGQMNKAEARYAEHLNLLKMAGEIHDWKYEPIMLRLAPDVRYSPDFLVIMPDGLIVFDEFKGHRDWAGLVRTRTAAQLFPWWTFRIVSEIRKRDGGGWKIEEV